ncbi:MAG TPA: EscF/YscF/HrpA family type III secretion system needle major subunit [Usitatibacter sp.]|nr:EscF/YscF/HrpA family type III secretion system needle major subunit [Usitatibacter sp.]
MSLSPIGGGGLTFDYLNSTVYNVVQNREQALLTQIGALGNSPTTAELLAMQQQIQQWTMLTQIQSTVVKEVGDALKGIIQKAA